MESDNELEKTWLYGLALLPFPTEEKTKSKIPKALYNKNLQ
jgi:hypothetical protein